MRNIEILREILKLIDKERRGEFSKAASTLATIHELIVEERPVLVHYNKDQMNLEGIE
jgi:hypothetical protein